MDWDTNQTAEVSIGRQTVPFDDMSTAEFIRDKVSVWVHLGILILGLISNPLILIILSRKKHGSKSLH